MDSGASRHFDAASDQEPASASEAATNEGRKPRYTLLLRTAKLIADGAEHLCIPRNLSGNDVTLQLFQPRPTAVRYELETASGIRYPLEPAWSEGELEAFKFLTDDGLLTLSDDLRIDDASHAIRLQRQVNGVLRIDGKTIDISFINLSQHGACIECSRRLKLLEFVRIRIDELPEIFAKVLWRQHNLYGLIFEQSYRFEELARRFAPEVWPEDPVDDGMIG
jgi:hypothetical protein